MRYELLRILLVDDNHYMRVLLAEILEMMLEERMVMSVAVRLGRVLRAVMERHIRHAASPAWP